MGGAALGLEGVRRLPVAFRLLSDDRLADYAADGDAAAFAAIYARYHQPLYRYCLAIVRESEDAQDALQNSMVKAWRGMAARDRDPPLRAWLFRIAHNESVSTLRRRSVAGALDERSGVAAPDPERELDARSRVRQLVSDLRRLPERPRGALVMRELAGLEYEEIAAALGVSPGAARQLVYEARVGLHEFAEGRAMKCEDVRRSISDGDGRRIRSRRLRAHLSECADCRHFAERIADRRRDLAALAPPLPVGTAASVLHAVLGSGGGGPGGGGLLAGLGGGTGQLATAVTGAKGLAATVALVTTAAVGLAIQGKPDAGAPKQVSVSPAAVVERDVSRHPARASRSRPARRAERKADRRQRRPRAPRATPRVTKGIPLDRAGPGFQSAPDHAAAPPGAAPSDPPSNGRGAGGDPDLVAGLVSTTTALGAPALTSEEATPIDLPKLDATTLLRGDLLAEQLTGDR